MEERGAAPAPDERRGAADRPSPRLAFWVPAIYATVSVAWITLSDAFLAAVEPSVEGVAWWSTVKGMGFVAATTAGLWAGLRWATARERRAAGALRRAERRYDLLADHTRDVILFVRARDGRILDANAAAAAAYGWSRDELRAMSVIDLRAPGTAALVAAQMAEADARGVRFETVHRRRDGGTFPVEVASQGTTLDGERVLVSVVRDATERRATEEALRESEERLALAIDAAGLGTFHAVPYGRMEWSSRCREIFGVEDAEIPDFGAFLALVHPDDRQAVREAATRWTDPHGDGRYQQQYRIVRPDGNVRWISAHGIARFAEVDGVRRPVRLAGTLFDVTDVKAVQAQLMQSDRLASVGMLAAGVAHEINNPLAYLSAALDFLHEHAGRLASAASGDEAEVRRALADAREGAERVRHVVRDLRTFSGAREERRTRVELEPVVESAIHLAANEIRYRARLVRDYGSTPAVMADGTRLGQVVLNLLINAAQAIPDGRADGHEIRIVTRTDAAGRAVLEVRDTGVGIPPEIADRIFDPFFTTKPSGVGTGLGLAICRGIVLGLGGEIAAESRPGHGTTMRIALPAAPAAAGEAPAPAAAASAGRRGRVLVVDDEPAVAAAVRRVLAPQHDVVVRGSAEEALDAIGRGERFDAILCDLMMPRMTGMELHAALARTAPDQASRMVVLTGGAFTEGAREFLDRVPLPRCEKPFDVAGLREVVRKVVG
ncbi:MAG TPA: PAS domain S-box protein [Anaeromyxobacter sp.]|nr:PAS domain S-box protein [Anaeromyxobacter sp.]